MKNSRRVVRTLRRTVLIVGEGDAETNLLKHLRALYTSNGVGYSVKIVNASGKGAANVVDKAVRHSKDAAYDHKAVLLDTDTPCIIQARALAGAEGIELLEQEPCLEAWLLSLHGQVARGSSQQLKARFKKRFKHHAHEDGVFRQHFDKSFLDSIKSKDPLMRRLLKVMGV